MRLAEAFSVTAIGADRVFKSTHYETTKTGLKATEVQTKGGFMVKFPNGNSIRIETEEQLRAMGLDRGGGIVDLDSGEVVPVGADGSIDFRAMVATSAKGLSDDRQLDLLGSRDDANEEVED